MDTHTIRSAELTVNFMLPRTPRVSQRFDACGVVNEVTLHERHTFCEPEQRIPGRVTTWGLGLCGEFVAPGIAPEALPGARFPKFGVGLLTQRPEGGEHDVWKQYECEPFEIDVQKGAQELLFTQRALPCMGYGARIFKRYQVRDNRLILTVTFENVGERAIFLQEYQHNFVSVDHLPVREGYRLKLPFVRDMAAFADCCSALETQEPCASFLRAQGKELCWTGETQGRFWFRILEGEQVEPCQDFYWKLTHENSPASVSESLSFVPAKAVLWGISHCICTELYFAQEVAPGETASWQRVWTFEEGAPK